MTTLGTTSSSSGTGRSGSTSDCRRGGSFKKPLATTGAPALPAPEPGRPGCRCNCGRREAVVAAPSARQRSSTASCTSASSATSVPGSSENSDDREPAPPSASGNPNWAGVLADSTSRPDTRGCIAASSDAASFLRDRRANLRTSIPNSAAIALASRRASASAPRLTSSRSPVASPVH